MNDKFKHNILCLFISFISVITFFVIKSGVGQYDRLIALLIGVLIALGKEIIYDKLLRNGTPEKLDFIFGVTGSLAGIGLFDTFMTMINIQP